MISVAEAKAASLACWRGRPRFTRVEGGISNLSFVAQDAGERFLVRLGDDLPVHDVRREREAAISRAAHAAGISPELVHTAPGAMVFRYVEGHTLSAEDVRRPEMLGRIVRLVQDAHQRIPAHLAGPPAPFAVFEVLRRYARQLQADGHRLAPEVARFRAAARALEREIAPLPHAFGHNDLLAANLIDDGRRLWLIDWEYGGLVNPLFDLANLTSNNGLTPDLERAVLETYFARPVSRGLWRSYAGMRCVSLLREAMWSMVSELHLRIEFDYAAYTALYLERFERAYAAWREVRA